jgi:glutathione S-transferase
MILFGASVSPFVRKVLMAAKEKDIELENKPLSPHADDPEFKKASVLGKIPALLDGDFGLSDSSAIVHYLEAKFPAKPLIPSEPKARGMTIWFEEYADTVMFATGTAIFFNRVVMPKIRKAPGDYAKADEAAATQVPPIMAYLESAVPAQGYLVGNDLTLADIAVTCQLINLDHAGVQVDTAKYPKLAAYYARISSRPSVRGIVELEKRFLAG